MATTTSTQLKPRLKNLDDLFQLNGGVNPLDQDIPIERQGVKRTQSVMAINELTPFSKHSFRLYEGERLNDMVDSIKKSGVLVPVIVRQVGSLFEILSGHNRVNAARLSYANNKIEELDMKRQPLIKAIADMTAGAVSPNKLNQISGYLSDWNNIDITNKRFVLDGLINQINLTSDTVKIEWKI